MNKNEEIILTVTDMTFDGAGVGHVPLPEGGVFPIFVRSCAVGDRVRCKVIKVNRRYAAAIPLEIPEPSPDRIHPDCTAAEKCGGCSFRHLSYEAELRYKTEAVRRVWQLNGPEGVDVADCIPSPEINGYRNKLQLPLSPDGRFGFYAQKSHRVIPVDGCAAAHPDLWKPVRITEEWIKEKHITPYDETTGKGVVRHLFLRRGYHTGQIMACAVIKGAPDAVWSDWAERLCANGVTGVWINRNDRNTNVIFGETWTHLAGEKQIEDTMNGRTFFISPPSFYQVNTAQAERIYTAAAKFLSSDDILLDLYCGIGTIGLCCADRVSRIIGAEVVPEAVKDAKRNAVRNGIKNADFFVADASDILTKLCAFPKPTTVIVDPPRKGLSPAAVDALRTLAPEKIIYISCDPATQARDAKALFPDYRCSAVQPYDMFPRTRHCESVVLLNRNSEVHYMNLSPEPFEMIRSGQKTIELRLFDKKRQKIKSGDEIVFTNTADGRMLEVIVSGVHKFDTFEELYQSLPLLQCGYTEESVKTASSSDMEAYYSVDQQKKYGVIGIEIFLPKESSDETTRLLSRQ